MKNESINVGIARCQSLEDSNSLAYGFIFCKTGKESKIANRLAALYSDLKVLIPRKVLYVRMNKRLEEKVSILFPGYILFQAPRSFPVKELVKDNDIHRVLTSSNEGWFLSGDDEKIARGLFEIGGLVGISKVYYEDDRVRVVSGLLCDYEGNIIRVDRRRSKAQVRFRIGCQEITTWLGFEEIDKLPNQ